MKKYIILLIILSIAFTSCNRYNKSVFNKNCHTSKKEIEFMEKQRINQYNKRHQ